MTKDEVNVDVLILGAGPAGCATALALLAGGVGRVLLVDRPSTRSPCLGEAAPPDVGRLLQRLGLECDLARLGHRAHYANLALWGDSAPIADHFLRRGWDHGWHLDRAGFDDWLRGAARARGAMVARPATVDTILPQPGGWRIAVSGFGSVFAHLVVDAAGRRAPLATRLGARRRQLDSLVALGVRTAQAPHAALAGLSLIEPFAEGWWYAAPLPGAEAIVMLVTDRDIAVARKFRDPEVFGEMWRRTERLARVLPAPLDPVAVTVTAAHTGFVDRAAGRGWFAVGDALMALDPLASCGISGALDDALSAAPAIVAQLEGGDAVDAGRIYARRATAAFARYLTERRRHYSAERRWPDSPFWARRAAPAGNGRADARAAWPPGRNQPNLGFRVSNAV